MMEEDFVKWAKEASVTLVEGMEKQLKNGIVEFDADDILGCYILALDWDKEVTSTWSLVDKLLSAHMRHCCDHTKDGCRVFNIMENK